MNCSPVNRGTEFYKYTLSTGVLSTFSIQGLIVNGNWVLIGQKIYNTAFQSGPPSQVCAGYLTQSDAGAIMVEERLEPRAHHPPGQCASAALVS